MTKTKPTLNLDEKIAEFLELYKKQYTIGYPGPIDATHLVKDLIADRKRLQKENEKLRNLFMRLSKLSSMKPEEAFVIARGIADEISKSIESDTSND